MGDWPVNSSDGVAVEAEQCMLGGMLLAAAAVADAVELVREDDLLDIRHRSIFRALLALYSHGEPTDVVAAADWLLTTGDLAAAGGIAYLHALTSMVTTPAGTAHRAGVVADRAILRRLAVTAEEIAVAARTGRADPNDLVVWAAAAVHAITGPPRADDAVSAAVMLDMAVEMVELLAVSDGRAAEVQTGIPDVDDLTGGLRPGELYVIAGDTGAGKSMFALDVARHAAIRQGMPVLMFSLEMSAGEVGTRLLAAESGVPLAALRAGRIDPRGWAAIAAARSKVRDAPFVVDDRPSVSVDDVLLAARQMRSRTELRLLIIDHLQLLGGAPSARSLKLLARELRVPVLLVSQLDGGATSPVLSAVPAARDADVVLLIDGAHLVVAKHRNGPPATLTLERQPHLARFAST